MSALGGATLLATAEETTYGTPVAVDRRYEFLSETLARQQTILQSDGIDGRSELTRRGIRRVLSNRSAAGDVTMEIAKQGFGRWFQHMLGGVSTIVQQGATAAWLQTHTFGSLDGKSLTVQKALRDANETEVGTFNLHGVKIASWTMSVSVDAIPSLQVTLDAEDVDVTTPITTIEGLAQPAGGLFSFLDGSVSLGGTPVAQVLTAEITGDNALKTDEYFLGSAGLKGEPPVNDRRTITGQFGMRFADLATVYDVFAADTGLSLELEFIGDVISGAENEELRITIPQVHLTGSTPQVSGVGVVELTAAFEASDDDTNPFATIEYQSIDTAI